jgi:hypothetical protein
MKQHYRSFFGIIALALSLLVFGSASAQNANMVVTMTTPDGKLVTTEKQKIAEFTIKGLDTQADIDAFTSKALAYGKVISFYISPDLVNGERKCKATFAKGLEKGYFKGLLTHLGISKVIINGQEKPVSEFGTK